MKPIVFGTIFLLLIFVPLILPNLILHFLSKGNVYIYYQIEGDTTNELHILQVANNIMSVIIKL